MSFSDYRIWCTSIVLGSHICEGLQKKRIPSTVGVVVRALASHQCGPGLIPGEDAICGLGFFCWFSLLFREVFLRVLRFFCLLKTLPNSNSIWNARRHFNEFLRIPKCFMGKQIDLVTVVEPILTSEITVFVWESNFLSKIVRSEALVYNSYFFQNSCFTEIIRH